ncbi:MAG: lipid A deacylase LpxR family protein [Verrucomicrobiota bacterium JB022]|nr:lipid A deacylase LpxR family protein [Verrucomicrobiota bacterium JB022]
MLPLLALPFWPGAALRAQALPEPHPPSLFSLYFENDLFARTDKNYTNGVKATWVSPQMPEQGPQPADWADWVMQHLPWIHQEAVRDRHVAFSLGQNLYTPQDINSREPQIDDRPYAAWLYGSVGLHHRSDNWLDTLELTVGVVGPLALGEETQNTIHRIKGAARANGWDNQIHNEPGVNLVWERKWRHLLLGDMELMGFEMFYHTGFSVGNVFTYGNAGGGARVGWNLTEDYGVAIIRPAGDATVPITDPIGGKFSLFLFGSLDSRGVIRDITLDGNTFRESYRAEKEPLVTDFVGGVSLVYNGWKLSYAQIIRTTQFEEGGQHAFGSMNLSFEY